MKFYKKTLTLSAGVWERIEVGGTQILFIRGDDVDVQLLSHRSARGILENVPEGIVLRALEKFDAVRMKHDSGTTVEFVVSDDEIDLQAVAQSVTIASPLGPNSAVEVEDTAGNSFAELLAELQTQVTRLTTLRDLFQSAKDQRTPLTTFTNATKSSVSGTSSVEVSAAANTGGVVLRYGMSVDEATSSGIKVGGQFLIQALGQNDTTNGVGGVTGETVRDLLIPAGEALEIEAGSSGRTSVWYEVL